VVLAACVRDAATVEQALAGFVARRSPRTGWIRARDLPPALRNLTLRTLGRRIFRSHYRPLLAPISYP
jgi:hypothetical protein